MDSYQAFLQRYPEFAATDAIDRLRETEYRRLDEQGHTYLDYTGGSLHAASQVTAHAALLNEHVFGNPHSGSPTSLATTTLVERTRRTVPAAGPGPGRLGTVRQLLHSSGSPTGTEPSSAVVHPARESSSVGASGAQTGRTVAISPDDGTLIDLRNRWLAALLAWCVPGLGHFYQGRTHKGGLFLGAILGMFLAGL